MEFILYDIKIYKITFQINFNKKKVCLYEMPHKGQPQDTLATAEALTDKAKNKKSKKNKKQILHQMPIVHQFTKKVLDL